MIQVEKVCTRLQQVLVHNNMHRGYFLCAICLTIKKIYIMDFKLFSTFLLFIFFSCSEEYTVEHIPAEETIHITFTNIKEQTSLFIEQIESIDVVPLDSREAILPPDAQIRTTHEHIYIFSRKQQEVLIFNKQTGEYVNKISKQGNGPEEYVYTSSFCLTKQSEIVLFDTRYLKSLYFDKVGNFLKTVKIELPLTSISYLNDTTYVGYIKNAKNFSEKKRLILFLDEEGKEKQSFLRLPDWIYKSPANPAFGSVFSYLDMEPLFIVPNWNYVYSFTSDTIQCRYYIDFDKKAIPYSFYEEYQDIIINGDIGIVLNEIFQNQWAFAVEYFQESSQSVFFQYMIDRQIYYALYNKETKTALTTPHLSLPPEWTLVVKPSQGADDEGFYSMVFISQLSNLIEFEEQFKDNRILNLIAQFKEYSNKIKLQEDDYVLLHYKMKSHE